MEEYNATGSEEKMLAHLTDVISHNSDKYNALAVSYGEPAQHDLAAQVAQSLVLSQKHADFQERFSHEVEGARGFNFLDIFTKIGQGVASIGKKIKEAVDKKKAAKAAAAAKPMEEKKNADANAEAAKKKSMVTWIVVGTGILIVIIIGGVIMFSGDGKGKGK